MYGYVFTRSSALPGDSRRLGRAGRGPVAVGLGGWLGMREREPSLRLLVVAVTLLGAMLTAATALAMVWIVPL